MTQPAAGARPHPVGTAYLFHFDQRYEHAGHYTGWATDLDRRLPEHFSGRGARLLEVITQAGIGFRLARTWPGVTRARERQLKNQGGASRYCPICQDERKARGLPRRPTRTPAPASRQQPAGPTTRPGAGAVPTRGVTPDQARAFLWLNPAFARPVGASLAVQWGRVRGREAVELAGPRVTVAWFDENQQLSQRRVAAVGRRATRARARARAEQAAEQDERARTRALAARTRQRLAARQPQQRAGGGERPARRCQEAEHER
jgi:predicted GIY-YIG superfamily endonuclease